MKKVLHLTLYLDIGGLERMILILCRGQKAAGWQPEVVVYEKGTGELLPQFESEKIPVIFFPKGRGFSVRLLFQILTLMRKSEITLLHSHDLGALIYATLVRLISGGKIRVVHTQHSFQHLRSRKLFLYERIFPWLANRLVCVSEDLRRTYLRLGQPLDRLRVVPNGVDFGTGKFDSEKRNELRCRLLALHGLPQALAGKRWVITLGRLASVKGPQHALSVWRETRVENSVLLLVGPDSEQGMLAKLQGSAPPNTFFPGATLDPQSWLRAADLFLSASEFEGLPLSALEAAAAELPMLLSDIPGHALFRGWAGFFSPTAAQEGARAIERFFNTGSLGEKTLAMSALGRLERSCGARTMTERYLRIYSELT